MQHQSRGVIEDMIYHLVYLENYQLISLRELRSIVIYGMNASLFINYKTIGKQIHLLKNVYHNEETTQAVCLTTFINCVAQE